LLSPVSRASIVGRAQSLKHTKIGGLGETPGMVWIDVPREAADPTATVLKLEFDEPLRLYTGVGRG
jgi:alpha-L-fucosidase